MIPDGELGTEFDNLLRDAEFEKTATRKAQAKAKADETSEQAAKLAALAETEPDDGGDGGSGDGQEP